VEDLWGIYSKHNSSLTALWGCVVVAVVLSRWWLGLHCHGKVVIVVGLSLWSLVVGLSWW